MEFQVTETHIRVGSRNRYAGNPIDRAVREKLKAVVVITEDNFMIVGSKGTLHVPLPGPVRRRLNYYMRTGNMKPFSFEL